MLSRHFKTNRLTLILIFLIGFGSFLWPAKIIFSVSTTDDPTGDTSGLWIDPNVYEEIKQDKASEINEVNNKNQDSLKDRNKTDSESAKKTAQKIQELQKKDENECFAENKIPAEGQNSTMEDPGNDRSSSNSASGSFVPVVEQNGTLMNLTRDIRNRIEEVNTSVSHGEQLSMEICKYIKAVKRVQQAMEYKEFVADPAERMRAASKIEEYKAAQYKFLNSGWISPGDKTDSDGKPDMPLYPLNYEDHIQAIKKEQGDILRVEIKKNGGQDNGKIIYADQIARSLENDEVRNDLQSMRSTVKQQDINNLINKTGDLSAEQQMNIFEQMFQPQNNPLGSYVLAKQILANRQNQAEQNAREELANNGGFLSVRKCADGQMIEQDGKKYCKKYETVTPGAIVRSGAEEATNARLNQYIQAKELGDTSFDNEPMVSETAYFQPKITGGGNQITDQLDLYDKTKQSNFNISQYISQLNTNFFGTNEQGNNTQNSEEGGSNWLLVFQDFYDWLMGVSNNNNQNENNGSGDNNTSGETNTNDPAANQDPEDTNSGTSYNSNNTLPSAVITLKKIDANRAELSWSSKNVAACYAENNWFTKGIAKVIGVSPLKTLLGNYRLIHGRGDSIGTTAQTATISIPLPKATSTLSIDFIDNSSTTIKDSYSETNSNTTRDNKGLAKLNRYELPGEKDIDAKTLVSLSFRYQGKTAIYKISQDDLYVINNNPIDAPLTIDLTNPEPAFSLGVDYDQVIPNFATLIRKEFPDLQVNYSVTDDGDGHGISAYLDVNLSSNYKIVCSRATIMVASGETGT